MKPQKYERICLLDPGLELKDLHDSSVTNPALTTMSVNVVTEKTHIMLSRG